MAGTIRVSSLNSLRVSPAVQLSDCLQLSCVKLSHECCLEARGDTSAVFPPLLSLLAEKQIPVIANVTGTSFHKSGDIYYKVKPTETRVTLHV